MTVSHKGITYLILNPSAGWNTVSKDFLNVISDFFRKIGVSEVFVTWVWNDNPSSFHNKGMAMDILYLKYKSGEMHHFSRMNDGYRVSNDDSLYEKVRSYIAPKYNYEYISPGTVDTAYHKASDNIYRKHSKDKAAKLINSAGYEINKSHLDHLHIAVDPNPENRKSRPGKGSDSGILIPLVLGFGIFRLLK